MDHLPNLADIMAHIHLGLNKQSELRHSISRDNAADYITLSTASRPNISFKLSTVPCTNFHFEFPSSETLGSLQDVSELYVMIELEKVIVVTSFVVVSL